MTAAAASPARGCEGCGLCCKIMGVNEIEKPPHRWCSHFSKRGGCAIYETRPGACRAFNCLWLLTEALGQEWRPDRAGFVLHTELSGQRLIVETEPSRPNAWRKAPFEAAIRAWASSGLEVMVFCGASGLRLLASGAEVPVRRKL